MSDYSSYYLNGSHQTLTQSLISTHLLWVHKAVMVEILVVYGEASHSSHLRVAGLVEVLAHHKHWIVHHTGGALGHGVNPDNVDNVYDALENTMTVIIIYIIKLLFTT